MAHNKVNYTELTHQVVHNAKEPLTFDEIIQHVADIEPITTGNPQNTIRSAISQARLIQSTGDGHFGWLPHLLRDNTFRHPLTAGELKDRRLSFKDELRDALWPSFFAIEKRRDRSPVSVKLDHGLIVDMPLEPGRRDWGTTAVPAFWQWLGEQNAQAGDDLIFQVIDADSKQYSVKIQYQADRDEARITERNRELAGASYEIIQETLRKKASIWNLAVRLIARGVYRDPCPPDPLVQVLEDDSRFVDVGLHQIMLTEYMTPREIQTVEERREWLEQMLRRGGPSSDDLVRRLIAQGRYEEAIELM